MAEVERFETMRHESGPHILIATCPAALDEVHLHVVLDHGHGYTALNESGEWRTIERNEAAPVAYRFRWQLWQQLTDMIVGAAPTARLVSETTLDAIADARAVRDRLLTLVEQWSE